MKVSLDIDKLLQEGKITEQEYSRLKKLSAETTGSLGLNILLGFGVLAVVGGTLALLPMESTAIILGLFTGAVGLAIQKEYQRQWGFLGNICVLVGALLAGGGVIILSKASLTAFIGIAVFFAAAGILARSGLLMSLSAFAIFSAIGARTGYFHAAYYFGVEAPTLTVVLFTALGIAVFYLSKLLKNLDVEYESLAIIFSRTCLVIANMGFWIGSLWGGEEGTAPVVFAVGWALALIVTGVWGVIRNRRWVVNAVSVFGAIHFYTQYFEYLGRTPGSLIIAGLIAIGIVIALRWYNLHHTELLKEPAA